MASPSNTLRRYFATKTKWTCILKTQCRQQQEPAEATQERINAASERHRNFRPSGRGGCQGLSCEEVARLLYLDDDTSRTWAKRSGEGGAQGLMRFEGGGSANHLSQAQKGALKAWIGATLPHSMRQVGA